MAGLARTRSETRVDSSSFYKTAVAFASELGLSLAVGGVMFLVAARAARSLKDGDGKSGISAKELAQRLGRPDLTNVVLTSHEAAIAAEDVVDPSDISASFDEIGGLDEQKEAIFNLTVFPLRHPELFAARNSSLVTLPKGILLYGRPGTGKTMLAKAIAKESGATFINLNMSSIKSKWFGESGKMVNAVFQLARKLAPSIIFIDEIDSFMTSRGKEGASYCPTTSSMMAEFMTLWDGLTSSSSHGIIVLGATNRPYDIDTAILRRLPASFEIPLPQLEQRHQILTVVLRREKLHETVDLKGLAKRTEGFSGSDLKELCGAAAMGPVSQAARWAQRRLRRERCGTDREEEEQEEEPDVQRPLLNQDFERALEKIRPAGEGAQEYMRREWDEDGGEAAGSPDAQRDLQKQQQLLAVMAALSNALPRGQAAPSSQWARSHPSHGRGDGPGGGGALD